MKIGTQFSIFLVNKPGVLAQITSALADAKVNIIALALIDTGEQGTLRIVCDDAETTRKVLSKEHDRWTESEVGLLDLDNTPGVFAGICGKLAEAGININYAYCTGGAAGAKTTAVLKLLDIKQAQNILGG